MLKVSPPVAPIVAPVCPVPVSRDDAESLLGLIAQGDSALQKISAAMTSRLDAVRLEFQPRLEEAQRKLNAQRGALETWAWENQRTDFQEHRSLPWLHGTIGFRWGKLKLATLSRITWDQALEKIRALKPEYIRVKEEVNKELILADRSEDLINAGGLSAIGLKASQEESFYIDLKS